MHVHKSDQQLNKCLDIKLGRPKWYAYVGGASENTARVCNDVRRLRSQVCVDMSGGHCKHFMHVGVADTPYHFSYRSLTSHSS